MQNAAMNRTNDLLDRTKRFALDTIKFCESLPKDAQSAPLHREASELVAIAVSSLNTARRNSGVQE